MAMAERLGFRRLKLGTRSAGQRNKMKSTLVSWMPVVMRDGVLLDFGTPDIGLLHLKQLYDVGQRLDPFLGKDDRDNDLAKLFDSLIYRFQIVTKLAGNNRRFRDEPPESVNIGSAFVKFLLHRLQSLLELSLIHI